MDTRIKRQFGVAFARAFALSPTLIADLDQLRLAKVSIRTVKGCTGWSITEEKIMTLGRDCALGTRLLNFAHEAYHVLHGKTPMTNVRRMSRARFIRQALDEETDCIVHEMQVMYELFEAGANVIFPEGEMLWYRRFRRGGRRAVRRNIGATANAINNKPMAERYGQIWDAEGDDDNAA
jgi:hypothetical protein